MKSRNLFIVAASFAALALLTAAAADKHMWQLPIGGYEAGVRMWGVDQIGDIHALGGVQASGVVSADGGFNVAGVAVPTSSLQGVLGSMALHHKAGYAALLDAGAGSGAAIAVDLGATYIDGGAPVCQCHDEKNSILVTCSPNRAQTGMTATAATDGIGDYVAYSCDFP